VAKLVDKQQPTDAEIQKNFDQQRDQILDQRRNEAFQLFASSVVNDYHKSNRVRINTKAQTPDTGE
jgi:peptidyl-prolyl cis-trans isomerase D